MTKIEISNLPMTVLWRTLKSVCKVQKISCRVLMSAGWKRRRGVGKGRWFRFRVPILALHVIVLSHPGRRELFVSARARAKEHIATIMLSKSIVQRGYRFYSARLLLPYQNAYTPGHSSTIATSS